VSGFSALADGTILPGVMERDADASLHGGLNSPDASHVISATDAYLQLVRSDGPRSDLRAAREALKKAVLQFPDEVNDCCYECGSTAWTALSIAATYNDCDMVSFLLDNGAYPFFASTQEMQELLAPGSRVDAKIKEKLVAAQRVYNLLEAIISSRNTKRM